MVVLQTKGVSYTYPQTGSVHHAAIKDISLSLQKGEVTGIIGHTGSGKSTLLQTFNGLIKPNTGTVLLNGQDLWENPKKIAEKRFHVGLVFQYPEHQLFEETVFKDIAFGPSNMGLDQQEINRRVHLYTKMLGLSESYLERSPFELSGGEKRRVALAGILVMEPEVLVLDEPTAGLDPIGRAMLFKAIQAYKARTGAAVIIVSHSMEDLAQLCTRLLVLQKGRLVLSGTVAEVFSNHERLRQMGLEVPLVTRVLLYLQQSGVAVQPNAFTVEQAVQQLLAVYKGGAGRAE